jgi:molybdopterin/thiamine biosynthesis adenylyltransferase
VTSQQESALAALISADALRNARRLEDHELQQPWATSRRIVGGVEGAAIVRGRELKMRVAVCARFPSAAPHVFVVEAPPSGTAAHVEADGCVCYIEREGLIVDRRQPDAVVLEALALAVRTLQTTHPPTDFIDELDAYWCELAGTKRAECYVEPSEIVRKIIYCRERSVRVVADNAAAIRAFSPRSSVRLPERRAIYVPLRASAASAIGNPRSLLSAAVLRGLVEQHSCGRNRQRLEALVRRHGSTDLVVLGIPTSRGARVLIGVEFAGVRGGHPLTPVASVTEVHAVALDRRDRSAVAERGGAMNALHSKRVAIVGCGSVGGHVAAGLASCGVGSLVLIDPDRLATENAFRHVLGASAIGQFKADALKRELEAKLPYIDVAVGREHGELLARRGDTLLFGADLIVVATGDPTSTLELNELTWRAAAAPPLVVAWLEPLGLGGHVLTIARGNGARGCYECLFAPRPGAGLANSADFAAPDQRFAIAQAGCSSAYTPYGDLDARRTAEVAARVACVALKDEQRPASLVSWKGDARAFLGAGFALSPRYNTPVGELADGTRTFARPDCTVCACS